ncbi:phage tail protein [Pseudomonadota bacterium]
MSSNAYLPTAFYFKVTFSGSGGDRDTSFQEVSGISTGLDTESYTEGGENRFLYELPKRKKSSNLVLKRGLAGASSPLITWCRTTLEGDFSTAIKPKEVTVSLLNEKASIIRSWSFVNAYPISWEADPFNSTKNEVAIEKMELSYNYFTRLV